MGGRACWGRGLLGRGLLGGGESATDLYRGLQSLLEHARFPSANTLLPCRGTRLGALDHWERARGTPAGRSPWVWESTEVLAAPQPGLAFWSCALRPHKRSRCEFPRQGGTAAGWRTSEKTPERPGDLLSTEGARGRRGGQWTAPSRAPRSPEWGRSCTCPGRATGFLPRRPAPRFHRDASSLVLGSWQPREPADQAVRAEVAV